MLCVETRSWPNKYFLALTKYFRQEILRNGLDKSVSGVTHLDLAAHGTVSLSRCSTLKPTSGSVHSLPSAQVSQGYQIDSHLTEVQLWVSKDLYLIARVKIILPFYLQFYQFLCFVDLWNANIVLDLKYLTDFMNRRFMNS